MALFKKSRTSARSVQGNIVVLLFLVIIGAFLAFPLVYVIMSSLKPNNEIFIFPPRLYVINPTLVHYKNLFELSSNLWIPFSRYVFNSLFVTIISTVLYIFIASLAAYPLAKRDFPFKNLIFNIIVASLMFVPQVTFFPQYIIASKIGLIDNYYGLILMSVGGAFGLFLMKQFMEQIPTTFIEAAKIDGSDELKTYFLIIMPNVKPAWITLSIFSFQGIWSSGYGILTLSEEIKLLPTAISQIMSSSAIARAGEGMAAVVILMLPPLILFIVLQSRIMETMAYAGIKE